MGCRILRPKFHLRVLRLGHRHSPQRCGEFWREGVWWCGGAVRSLWLCALVLSVFVITIVEEAVGTMLCGQHEIEIIIINCLFLSHPSISGFRSSLCAVVLDGPRRFSLIWYLALLSWLSIVWFFGTVGGYLRGNSVQIYSHRPHVRMCGSKISPVPCVGRGSQLCVPDWRFYNRHPVKWLEEIPTSAPEKKTN